MKFRSFLWILTVGAITIFLVGMVGLGWIASQSSLNLLQGGINRVPMGTVFMPKQAPAMVSLLTNPEQLYGLRQVSLPLKQRYSDRQTWQKWEQDLVAKIGFDYHKNLKPWLGDEVTFAITTLDYDRNSNNGAQPGYLWAMKTKNTKLAQASLGNFYSDKLNYRASSENHLSREQYKGANIITTNTESVWNSVVVGNFVLFANYPQILKEAINQAQAVSLNLEKSNYYQAVLQNISQPHIAIAYIDVPELSAWFNKSKILTPSNSQQTLGISISIKGSDLAAQTALIEASNSNSVSQKSFLDYPELQQILASLPFDGKNSAYINIQDGKSLLEAKMPLYKVTKLAIQSLFPHLKAIAIHNLGKQDKISRANILFKLDT
jgi:hypothetical protein